jgi:hypothetical protein
MLEISAVGLFCEDIREERSGSNSIVGILPDNLSLSHIPGVLPKLCVYIRINIGLDRDPRPIVTYLILPNGETTAKRPLDDALIEKTRKRAKKDGSLFAGFISRIVMTPFPVEMAGRIQCLVTIGDTEYLCGALNLREQAELT